MTRSVIDGTAEGNQCIALSCSRVENKMVHRLEYVGGGNLRLVKIFSRSAAGSQVKTKPEELRPPTVCLKTADYLVNK